MYKQREIVLVPFPYSGLSSSKRRPVLILSSNSYNASFSNILGCVITSNRFKDAYPVALQDSDLEAGLLPEESVTKCHKLFTTEQSQVIKRFSVVREQKFEEVKQKIIDLLQTSR